MVGLWKLIQGALRHLGLILLMTAINHTVMQTVKQSQTDIHTEILELLCELTTQIKYVDTLKHQKCPKALSFSQWYLHRCLKNKLTCKYLARISWHKDSFAWGHTTASPSFPLNHVLSLFHGYVKRNEKEWINMWQMCGKTKERVMIFIYFFV